MFYGIIVWMFFFDNKKHHRSHIRVQYGEHEAVIAIDDGEVLEGDLPKPKEKMVQAWIEIHEIAIYETRHRFAPSFSINFFAPPPEINP